MRSWRTVNNKRRHRSARPLGNGWDMSANGGGGRGLVTTDMTRLIRFGTREGTVVFEGTVAELLGVQSG